MVLPAGEDPCDLLSSRGEAGLREPLERARAWLEFLKEDLAGLRGAELAAAVDEVLNLVGRVPGPVHRDLCLKELAGFLALPEETLRLEAENLRRRERAPARPPSAGREPETDSGARGQQSDDRPLDLERRAFKELAGACLLDNSLIPAVEEWFASCPDGELRAVLACIRELHSSCEDDEPVDAQRVLCALADHEARHLVVPIEEYARCAESPQALAQGAMQRLGERRGALSCESRKQDLAQPWNEESHQRALRELHDALRRSKVPDAGHLN